MIRNHSEVGHTPGPWQYNNCTVYAGPKATPVAYTGAKFDIHDNSLESLAECHANARLISASPGLLQAAMRVVERFDTASPLCAVEILELEKAIAKAKGESHEMP